MHIALVIVGLVVGFFLLVRGADVFVDASVAIAEKLGIPHVIIGLTVVAMGTSAPEIVVSVSAAIQGSSDMAVGNIVGSNIFNLMFILGLCAIIRPIDIKLKDIAREHIIGTAAAVLLLVMKLVFNETIPRLASLVMLVGFLVYMTLLLRSALKNRGAGEQSSEQSTGAVNEKPLGKSVLFALFGLVLIVGGGQLAVYCAVEVAVTLGMSERVVGLTILAIGTSAPELITSLIACRKGEMDIALGNIIGSSFFNILFILGISGVILPLAVEANLITDLLVLIGGSVLFLIFAASRKKVGRVEGAFMFAIYAGYMAYILLWT